MKYTSASLEGLNTEPSSASPVAASIIVATWNSAEWLERSVGSALRQQGLPLEVIVADDASTDLTKQVVGQIIEADPRVHYIRLEANHGPSAARNAAIEASRGTWIAVLDADDAFEPERLARLVAFGEASGADIVLDNFIAVDEADEPVTGKAYLSGKKFAEARRIRLDDLIASSVQRPPGDFGYLKPILRRDFVSRKGILYDIGLRNSEDFHLLAECLAVGAVAWFTPFVGYRYTRRRGSLSHWVHPDILESVLLADEDFLGRHADRLDATTVKLLERRRAYLTNNLTAHRAMLSLRQRAIGQVAAALVRRPQSGRKFVTCLAEAMHKRLVHRRRSIGLKSGL